MLERLTAHARTILNLARREAHELGSEEVVPTHLLLAMTAVQEPGIGYAVLRNQGVDLDALRRKILEQMPRAEAARPLHMIALGKDIDELLVLAREEAAEMDCRFIGTEHLLISLMRLKRGPAYEILIAEPVSIDLMRQEAVILLGLEPQEILPSAAATRSTPPPAGSVRAEATVRDAARTPAPLPNFQLSLCRQIESLLSQLALWSKNPDILKTFSRLNEMLGEATATALTELNSLDLPDDLLEPAIDIFRLSQDKAEAVAVSDYAHASELHDRIGRILASQSEMSAEKARLAGELIDCEREKIQAVREERYEHAATCRDRSRSLRARWEQMTASTASAAAGRRSRRPVGE